MVDNLTKKQRSYTMSSIKSRWTSQEKLFHEILRFNNIYHKMHPKIIGKPDAIIPTLKKAVFIHGCFWHKCPKHFIAPKSNKSYWLPKLARNVAKDKENSKILRKKGWKVVVIWEHSMKNNPEKAVARILAR